MKIKLRAAFPAAAALAFVALVCIPLFLCPAAAAVGAATAADTVAGVLSRTEITVGDTFTYTIRFYPKGGQKPSGGMPDMSPFEALDFSETFAADASGAKYYFCRYTLTCFDYGMQEIPPVTFTEPGGRSARASGAKVNVKSLLADIEKAEFKEIKKQAAMRGRGRLLYYLIIILAVAAVLAGAYYLLRGKKKKDKPSPVKKEEKVVSPWITASEKLALLESKNLIREMRFMEFTGEISFIIREYIENRFGFLALEEPSPVISGYIKGIYKSGAIIDSLELFLEKTDLVKFGKYVPEPAELEELLSAGKNIVTLTTPGEKAEQK